MATKSSERTTNQTRPTSSGRFCVRGLSETFLGEEKEACGELASEPEPDDRYSFLVPNCCVFSLLHRSVSCRTELEQKIVAATNYSDWCALNYDFDAGNPICERQLSTVSFFALGEGSPGRRIGERRRGGKGSDLPIVVRFSPWGSEVVAQRLVSLSLKQQAALATLVALAAWVTLVAWAAWAALEMGECC